MRRTVILIFAAIIFLFPPYYDQGFFSSDWGWMFITDAFPPFAQDIWWLVWIVEFVLLGIVNMVWKRSETPQQLAITGQSQGHATPVAAQPTKDVATELGKLNELRIAGALSDEEFAEQKARLLGEKAAAGSMAASAPAATERSSGAPRATTSTVYPTARVQAAVEAGMAGGIRNFHNVAVVHHLLWRFDLPVPPTPYLDADQKMLGAFVAAAGLIFGLLMTLFGHLVFDEASFGSFAFLTLAFGGLMFITVPFQARKLRSKHNLPEWNDLPGGS